MKVEFTEEEANVLLALMEAGLKAVGGPAAEAYVVLKKRITDAAKAIPEPKPINGQADESLAA